MDNISVIEGYELAELLRSLGANTIQKDQTIHTIRINQRADGVAIKINSGCWSPTIGRRADSGGY